MRGLRCETLLVRVDKSRGSLIVSGKEFHILLLIKVHKLLVFIDCSLDRLYNALRTASNPE